MSKTAFVSPFTNTTNRYIDLQKQLLRDCGFAVKPLSIKAVLSGQAWGIFEPGNVMAFHWLETRPFVWKGAQPHLSLKGFLEFLFYLALIAMARARVVYFVHNHAVHDTSGWHKKLSAQLIRLLRTMADTRVVHDPSHAKPFQAVYLPHPLYWNDGKSSAPLPKLQAFESKVLQFGMLGAVRPYKNIHAILEIWPKGVPLLIRGRASDDYAARLNEIISRRQLAPAVSFQPGYMSDQDFSAHLATLDVLILAHIDDSMLVSGAFFEAAGQVPAIWARESPFIRWVSGRLPGTVPFKEDEALIEQVNALVGQAEAPLTAVAAPDQGAAAIRLFGWKECVRSYSAVFASTSSR